MRKIKINDILKKMYSIENNKIIKTENGEYFDEEIVKMIIINRKHNDLQNVEKLKKQDNKKHEKAVKKFCDNISKNITIEKYPSMIDKNYEVFKLDLPTEHIYLVNKNLLPESEKLEKTELFFKYELAKKAYNLLKKINESIAINHEETLTEINNEIQEFKDELIAIKKEDEEAYLESIKIYNKIKNTDFMIQYNNLINENKILNKKMKDAKKLVTDLKERNKILEEKIKSFISEDEEDESDENKKASLISKIFKKK